MESFNWFTEKLLIGNKLREDEGLTYSGYSYVNFMRHWLFSSVFCL